jgi:hypothetical protein
MGYAVAVSLKDGKDVFSPEMDDEQEAKRQLELVRATIGTTETVDLPWLHAKGQDIATADLNEWWE